MITFILVVFIILMILGLINDIGVFGTILCLVGIVLFIGFIGSLREKGKENMKTNSPEAWKQEEEKIEKETAKKYNNYMYTCPMCRSQKVRNLTFDEKTDPLKSMSRVGKNYHCDNCKYIW